MRQSARVLSTDALRNFQAALAKYSAKAREALRGALMDVRHTLDWLEVQTEGLDASGKSGTRRSTAAGRSWPSPAPPRKDGGRP